MAFIQGALLQRPRNRCHIKLYVFMITVGHEPYGYSSDQDQEIIYESRRAYKSKI